MHKYAWVIPFKDKNCNKITNAFQEVLNESRRKQNKIWVHKGIEFFNRTMNHHCKIMIQKFIHHIMKENLFRALQDNIYKHRTSIAKDFYIDELDNVINE